MKEMGSDGSLCSCQVISPEVPDVHSCISSRKIESIVTIYSDFLLKAVAWRVVSLWGILASESLIQSIAGLAYRTR